MLILTGIECKFRFTWIAAFRKKTEATLFWLEEGLELLQESLKPTLQWSRANVLQFVENVAYQGLEKPLHKKRTWRGEEGLLWKLNEIKKPYLHMLGLDVATRVKILVLG